MASPLRFLRRLFALPGNMERISTHAAKVDELMNVLQSLHGELRAMRLDSQELHQEQALRFRDARTAAEEKLHSIFQEIEQLRAGRSIFDRLGPMNDALQDIRKQTDLITRLSEFTSRVPEMNDALQDVRKQLNLLSRINDLVCDIKNSTEALEKGGPALHIDARLAEIKAAHRNAGNPKWLGAFEKQIYSQNGEDGIIAEIFRRIGTSTKIFVECGVSDGLECNTTALLAEGWTGYWAEMDPHFVKVIKDKFAPLLGRKLQLLETFLTAENVESTLAKVPKGIDLLSIDIDGNDYWLWKAIKTIDPRVVVIEYNATYQPPISWVMSYNPEHRWNGSRYYGASLLALTELAATKGYALVGCDLTGNNAFFIKQELVQEKFLTPATAEKHYEPPRYFLVHSEGHKRDFGSFEISPR